MKPVVPVFVGVEVSVKVVQVGYHGYLHVFFPVVDAGFGQFYFESAVLEEWFGMDGAGYGAVDVRSEVEFFEFNYA